MFLSFFLARNIQLLFLRNFIPLVLSNFDMHLFFLRNLQYLIVASEKLPQKLYPNRQSSFSQQIAIFSYFSGLIYHIQFPGKCIFLRSFDSQLLFLSNFNSLVPISWEITLFSYFPKKSTKYNFSLWEV